MARSTPRSTTRRPTAVPGVVFGFVGGDKARRFMGMRAHRRAAVLGNFRQFFGPKAGNPREYLEANWTREEWTRGCPVGIPGRAPCRLRRRLRAPVGPHPLGRDRDVDVLERLHGRRGSLRRARCQEILNEL